MFISAYTPLNTKYRRAVPDRPAILLPQESNLALKYYMIRKTT